MIYLIGTNHRFQYTENPSGGNPRAVEVARDEFRAYLREQIQKLRPNFIAEEFSEEVLKHLGAQSNVKAVADSLGIEHRFCDPDRATRRELGLPEPFDKPPPPAETARHYRIRERYWLSRISDRPDAVIIFVCGAEHIPSFESRLRAEKCETRILERYWGSKIYNRL
jgi:hypothetical protein